MARKWPVNGPIPATLAGFIAGFDRRCLSFLAHPVDNHAMIANSTMIPITISRLLNIFRVVSKLPSEEVNRVILGEKKIAVHQPKG